MRRLAGEWPPTPPTECQSCAFSVFATTHTLERRGHRLLPCFTMRRYRFQDCERLRVRSLWLRTASRCSYGHRRTRMDFAPHRRRRTPLGRPGPHLSRVSSSGTTIKCVARSPPRLSMDHTRWPSPDARCRLHTHIPHGHRVQASASCWGPPGSTPGWVGRAGPLPARSEAPLMVRTARI